MNDLEPIDERPSAAVGPCLVALYAFLTAVGAIMPSIIFGFLFRSNERVVCQTGIILFLEVFAWIGIFLVSSFSFLFCFAGTGSFFVNLLLLVVYIVLCVKKIPLSEDGTYKEKRCTLLVRFMQIFVLVLFVSLVAAGIYGGTQVFPTNESSCTDPQVYKVAYATTVMFLVLGGISVVAGACGICCKLCGCSQVLDESVKESIRLAKEQEEERKALVKKNNPMILY